MSKVIIYLLLYGVGFLISITVTWWIAGMEFDPMSWSQVDRGFWLFLTSTQSVVIPLLYSGFRG